MKSRGRSWWSSDPPGRAGRDRDVLAQTERVELVDPVVVVIVGVRRPLDPFHPRAWGPVQRPALGAVLSGGGRAIQHPALAPVKAGKVPATPERGPDEAVPVDIDATRTVTPRGGVAGRVVGRLVDL